jgi:RNA polymerase sigma-70 factor, ECF subfamily
MGRPLDRRAVDHLVVEHLPAALRFARRLTGDPQLAEEVVQDALCRVLARWRSFRGESSFRTWLLSIVVNVDRDRRRRVRTSELLDEGSLGRGARDQRSKRLHEHSPGP